jgi:urease accessory protein
LGNRHLPTELEWDNRSGPRILIARDPIIREMLAGLGATVVDVLEPFSPLHGAYHHAHGHALLNR